MTQEHSPTPWTFREEFDSIEDAAGLVVTFANALNDADAKLIVLAVNSHAALVAACDAALTHWHSKPSNFNKHEPAYLQMCRDALALAKENTK